MKNKKFNFKNLSSFLVGIIIGFILFFIFGSGKEGGNPKIGFNAILYRGNGNCIHIHHWVISAIIALIITITIIASGCYFNNIIFIVYGFLLGASLEDLRYKDFMKFEKKCL